MKRSNADIVLDAVQDLHAQEQVVTRETLAEVTGLKLTVIDDRISHLIDCGEVHRVQRGVFVPAPKHKPARIITKTVLPGGTVSIEIGDDHVLTLTPREDRMLAALMVGSAQQYAGIQASQEALQVANEIGLQVRQIKKELRALTPPGSGTGDQ